MTFYSGTGYIFSLVKLKYWHYTEVDRKGKDFSHRHNFWQMDIAEEGHAVMHMGKEDFSIAPGSFIIIPPGTTHFYRYNEYYRNWSFKFEMDYAEDAHPDPCVISSSDISDAVYRMILAVMNKHTPELGKFTLPEHISDIVLVEHLLAGIIFWAFDRQPHETIADRVCRLVNEKQGMPIKVEEIASKLGYSRAHLNVLVKESSGIPIKRLIDKERSIFAGRLLKYSDLNNSEIADTMGFPDVFSFSKFFKRLTGLSPNQWKAKQHFST